MQATKREIIRAREELGATRNYRIVIKDTFSVTLEAVVNKKMAEAMELAYIQAKTKRERMVEGALETAMTK